MKYVFLTAAFLLASSLAYSQSKPPLPQESVQELHKLNEQIAEEAQTSAHSASEQQDYRIGTEDLIDVAVFEVPELSRTVRVSAAGEISLPLLGAVKAAGLSPLDLEHSITARLRDTYVKDPQVTIFIREFHSDPVSVVGAVKVPGLYQIQTRKSLIEVLAMAQGFAEGPSRLPGRDIVVTRKPHDNNAAAVPGGEPSPRGDPPDPPSTTTTAADKPAGAETLAADKAAAAETVDVPIKELMESGDPKWNIPIYPGDVVKVVAAGTVYVAGDVTRPGAFPLIDFDNVSTIQALSMAGGSLKTAARKNSVIIRRDAAGNRIEQKVDLDRILKGQDRDALLGPNDILFVPGSVGKAAALKAIESTVQAATGMLIYHPL